MLAFRILISQIPGNELGSANFSSKTICSKRMSIVFPARSFDRKWAYLNSKIVLTMLYLIRVKSKVSLAIFWTYTHLFFDLSSTNPSNHFCKRGIMKKVKKVKKSKRWKKVHPTSCLHARVNAKDIKPKFGRIASLQARKQTQNIE